MQHFGGMLLQTPHLSKVLIDGCKRLTPCRLLQEYTEISVSEPAPFHPLTLCNAGDTDTSLILDFLFHIYTCSTSVKYQFKDIWIFTNLASNWLSKSSRSLGSVKRLHS